jgi:Mg-chelatase subunit ChlD
MSDNIIKPPEPSFSLTEGKLRSRQTPFQQRIAAAKQEQLDPSTMPNRIALMLDCSGSMSGEYIQLLKDAVQSFAQRCDFKNTSLAIETFPSGVSCPLTTALPVIMIQVEALTANGGTPMRSCVEKVIESVAFTRAVIVSDGQATDWRCDYDEDLREENYDTSSLKAYIEQKIPIDCVHIGGSSGGEELLKFIAKQTEGLFIKFTDVSAFSRNFGYLTPGFRAMLSDGRVTAESLGAREIEK